MNDKKTYTAKEVINMMQAYHNLVYALAENKFSKDSETRKKARESIDTKFKEEYEKRVPKEIRQGLDKKLHETITLYPDREGDPLYRAYELCDREGEYFREDVTPDGPDSAA